jgi:PAS domain S-box-containing protein
LAIEALRVTAQTSADDLPVVSYRIAEPSGAVAHVSPWIAELTGHDPEAWLGTIRWRTYIHPEDRADVELAHQAAVAAGRGFHREYRLVAADGATVWVEDTEVVSAPGLRLGVLVDTTARRQDQIADERRLATLGEALAEADRVRRVAADELHDHGLQVLTAVLVLLDRIELQAARAGRPADTAPVRRAVSYVMERLARLTFELSPQVVHARGLTEGVQATLAVAAEAAGWSTTVTGRLPRCSPDTEALAFTVVTEAINNVRRHAHAHQVWVEFEYWPGSLRVAVRDDGKGFDPEFARTGATKPGGIELAAQRVKFAGGRFRVESAPGAGARVTIELPA